MTSSVSTGIAGLDEILCGLRWGDNVVWQVERIGDYRRYAAAFVDKVLADGRRVLYIRFADHEPLLPEHPGIQTIRLDAEGGFESFSSRIHQIISEAGRLACYVFDCLSDLLSAWATDLMIGNFFMVTCPYLYEWDTLAYFGILRNHHSFHTIARIRETTQLLLDVYHLQGQDYIHPLKVWRRYSPTMYLPHIRQGEKFVPLSSSLDAARLFSHLSEQGLQRTERILDYWDRLFLEAQDLQGLPADTPQVRQMVEQICRVMVGREKRIGQLAGRYLTLEDLLAVKSRLIGSGYIGGKTAGMLIARRILQNDPSENWQERLEPHDSFYIGSDVFYTYIVENGWWKLFMDQKTPEGYFRAAAELKDKMLCGKFPEPIRRQFQEMMEYFGQSPIIVRSSSLLEDSFGNAFAGKYESIFLVNQGEPEERQARFEEAVRRIFASTMNENALTYRLQRGLAGHDEQMALLVQRVSGAYHRHYYFPAMAGVGVSYNTFVWNASLDPKAGMLRLVFGLGTRAVDRVEDDYPQTIALDDPLVRPYADRDGAGRFSQHKIDLLDVQENRLKAIDVQEILSEPLDLPLDLIVSPDEYLMRRLQETGRSDAKTYYLVTFRKLLAETAFPQLMHRLLKTLEAAYQYPVDIEFTVNFTQDGQLRINLVQCRPLQTKGIRADVRMPSAVPDEKIILRTEGFTMGPSVSLPIHRIIYVVPEPYLERSQNQKYEVARLIGRLNRTIEDREKTSVLLLGPGRWGTSTPSLGVPVRFAEISNVSVLAEIACEGTNLIPDLSFGTHFFQDLVESDIFYMAVFPARPEVLFRTEWFLNCPNVLEEFLPDAADYSDTIRFICLDNLGISLHLISDIISRRSILFLS